MIKRWLKTILVLVSLGSRQDCSILLCCALILQPRYPTLAERSPAPTMFLKAPSMGNIKQRIVFKDRLFSQAVQN